MRETPLVVNLFGGPGSGKSTTAAGVFFNMKMLHIEVELVLEYARELTFEENFYRLSDQTDILGEQHKRIRRLEGKVDCVVTDSPFLMGITYGHDSNKPPPVTFEPYVVDLFGQYDNLNFYLERGNGPYRKVGRYHTEEQAFEKDEQIKGILSKHSIPHTVVKSDGTAVQEVLIRVVNKLRGIENVWG